MNNSWAMGCGSALWIREHVFSVSRGREPSFCPPFKCWAWNKPKSFWDNPLNSTLYSPLCFPLWFPCFSEEASSGPKGLNLSSLKCCTGVNSNIYSRCPSGFQWNKNIAPVLVPRASSQSSLCSTQEACPVSVLILTSNLWFWQGWCGYIRWKEQQDDLMRLGDQHASCPCKAAGQSGICLLGCFCWGFCQFFKDLLICYKYKCLFCLYVYLHARRGHPVSL